MPPPPPLMPRPGIRRARLKPRAIAPVPVLFDAGLQRAREELRLARLTAELTTIDAELEARGEVCGG